MSDETPASGPRATRVRLDSSERRSHAERRRPDLIARAVLANLRDHLVVVGAVRDAAGRVVDWRYLQMDERVQAWLCLTPEDLERHTVSELLPHRWERLHERWLRALESGEPVEYESVHGEHQFRVRVFRIDADSIGSVSTEVTESRRAESALHTSEARFRALIEKSLEMIALVDRAGRLTYWSPGNTAILGWPSDEVIGTDFRALVHPEDLAGIERELAKIQANPARSLRLLARVRHRDGSWRVLEGIDRNLLDDPEVRAIVINARDVTLQQQLEAQLRQAQKLESVGRLAGGVAHDFNNLLTVILNCADFIEDDRRAGRLVDGEYLDQLRAAGERAGELTRSLLAFARKQVVAPEVLDLNQVVRASEKLLCRVLDDDIELVVRTADALWPVLCDRGQVEQALMNLVVNARDAMPGGGRLEIATGCHVVGAAQRGLHPECVEGDWVQLTVRDTGCGLSPEVRAHLFEPFFTTKEQGKGTGLGLATVHGIVAQAGGHVHVSSEPGRGTTFELCFPRSGSPLAAAQSLASPPVVGGHETVLVLEDDPLVRGVTVGILRSNGYRVIEAQSGREAQAAIAASDRLPVLVVTDVVMPGMNGPEAVQALRQRLPGLRALYVSGYLERSDVMQVLPESERNFLAKPFSVGELLARVRATLDDRRLQPA